MMKNCYTVTVPATSANLGPGFDCLGVALTLHNSFTFWRGETETRFEISGIDAHKLPVNEQNLVYQSAMALFERVGQRPFPLHVRQSNQIPVGSGLGSSSSAVIAGLMGANCFLERPLSRDEILQIAIDIEGHPDNVAPAMHGGLILSVMHSEGVIIEPIPTPLLQAVIVLPDFHLLTEESRAALPTQLTRQDAIFNSSRLALLVRTLERGQFDKLRIAMQDQIHQPFRLPQIPGTETAMAAAYEAGALGVALSGAGPSLLALVAKNAAPVAEVMQAAFQEAGLSSRAWQLSLDTQGTTVVNPLENES